MYNDKKELKMEKHYKVNVSFPDGHTQEMEDTFASLSDAVNFGYSMLSQIGETERFHKHDDFDPFSFDELQKPYFFVYEVVGGKKTCVYEGK